MKLFRDLSVGAYAIVTIAGIFTALASNSVEAAAMNTKATSCAATSDAVGFNYIPDTATIKSASLTAEGAGSLPNSMLSFAWGCYPQTGNLPSVTGSVNGASVNIPIPYSVSASANYGYSIIVSTNQATVGSLGGFFFGAGNCQYTGANAPQQNGIYYNICW